MNAYTVSRLAHDAGVSVHIVRDYVLRGLLRPVAHTAGGYGVFDADSLQRLCFVRAAFEAGIGLDTLTRLCRALDTADRDETAELLVDLCQLAYSTPNQPLILVANPSSIPTEKPPPVAMRSGHRLNDSERPAVILNALNKRPVLGLSSRFRSIRIASVFTS